LHPEGGLVLKIKTTDVADLLSTMNEHWDSYQTEERFTYAFMDDLFTKADTAEQKTSVILNIFAVLAIFVACLGLFGLATHTAEQRNKEIGIRKVLGTSALRVTQMLAYDFMKPILIASVIAFPVSWWVINSWLENFAYRIDLAWWMFV